MLSKLRNRVEDNPRATLLFRAVLCLAMAAAGMFLAEFAFNPGFLFSIPPSYLLCNYQIYLGFLLVVYFLGQQSRLSYAVFLALCQIIGLANHYVTLFKEAPVLPSDVLAIGTAA